MEEEERPALCVFASCEGRHSEPAPAGQASGFRGTEHERRAEDVERERFGGEVHEVLCHGVRRILGARETRFNEREACLHGDEREDDRDEHPDDVEVSLDGSRGDFRCNFEVSFKLLGKFC